MESILKKIRQYNIDHHILKSQNAVIDRLLDRSVEMKDAYNELGAKLGKCQQEFLWDAILGAATFFNPESSKNLREDQKTLVKLNKDIAKYASKLSDLMRSRYELSEASGFRSYEDFHVVDWIDRATENNYSYQSFVQEKLHNLSNRFNSKYWPKTFEVIGVISTFAEEAKVQITNEWTKELLASQKCSKADYLRVLLKAIEDKKISGPHTHILPKDFRITDRSLATLINGSLDLTAENIVCAEYVKRSRQNIRNKQRKECVA